MCAVEEEKIIIRLEPGNETIFFFPSENPSIMNSLVRHAYSTYPMEVGISWE